MSTKKCQGLFSKIFGHKYIPIFNIEEPEFIKGITSCRNPNGLIDLVNATKSKTYVKSICSRCGDEK